MDMPKVSIIIPVYKQANYLTHSIRSLLDQTYSNIEIVVVYAIIPTINVDNDDCIDDSTIKIVFVENCSGRAAAINAGIRASSGKIIAFLDANDKFHSEKVAAHVEFFESHPDISIAIDGYFTVTKAGEILSMNRSPSFSKLADIILDFPPVLSSLVVRRNLFDEMGLFEETDLLTDMLDLKCRLLLANYKFASIDRPLNYCLQDDEVQNGNLKSNAESVISVLESTFNNPLCPQSLQKHYGQILGNTYLYFAYLAYSYKEISLGQEYILKSIRLDRSYLDMQGSKFLTYMILASIQDDSDHGPRLQNVFCHLPPELAWITLYRDQAIAQGYVYRGVRSIIWRNVEDGSKELEVASELGAKIDKLFCYRLLNLITDYEQEFGYCSAEKLVWDLSYCLVTVGAVTLVRWFHGTYFINRGFRDYDKAQYKKVLYAVKKGVLIYPQYLANRGVLAIALHSALKELGRIHF